MGSVYQRQSDGRWAASVSRGPRGARVTTTRYAATEGDAVALLRDMEGPPEWLQVDRSGDCWIWRGSTANSGYGLARTTEGRRTHAHRLIYEREIGPIPEGMNVLHRCDNPPCVRPDHLFLGSQLANVRDMIAKGRAHFQSPAVRGRSNSSWGGRTPIPTA